MTKAYRHINKWFSKVFLQRFINIIQSMVTSSSSIDTDSIDKLFCIGTT